jgi:cytochrome c peroxidase
MKRYWMIILGAAVVALYAFYPAAPILHSPEQVIADTLLAQVDRFANNGLLNAVSNNASEKQLQQLFLQTQLAYKRFEWAAEYFDPAAATLINSAPVPEASPVYENGPGVYRTIQPQGLQVIETILFPHYDTRRKAELITLLSQLQAASQRYKRHFTTVPVLGGQVFDAAKLEVYRILILGLTDFDTPLTQQSLTESAVSLQGLKSALSAYSQSEDILLLLDSAAINLKHKNFNQFDRAYFITHYGNPLSRRISRLRQHLNIPLIRYPRLLQQDAETLFDPYAFNADAYAETPSTPAQVALGKRLFADPLLSGDGTRSCASCHQPDKAFTDGLVKNTALGTHQLLLRNTPTLINAALQPAFFYDLRAASLEDQIRDVLSDTLEMNSSVRVAPQDTSWVVAALAAYIRSLVKLNSRFDSYMQGSKQALTKQEVNGFNLFMGKARCGTCHYMPLFSGVFPPAYFRMDAEVVGVPKSVNGTEVDDDLGRGAITNTPFLMHAFKTTTVRNAARTAPYMHNGIFTTLEQVIDFYDKGAGTGLVNQTLSTDSLHLTSPEKAELIAFLKSLNSK